MSYQKCPRCNLNYISEGEKLCRICDQEVRRGGISKSEEEEEICSLCGENVVAKGKDLCAACHKEHLVTAAIKPEWGFTGEQDGNQPDNDSDDEIKLIQPDTSDIDEGETELDDDDDSD